MTQRQAGGLILRSGGGRVLKLRRLRLLPPDDVKRSVHDLSPDPELLV
jgi:hypothetical protein